MFLSFKLLVDYWGTASCHFFDHMTLFVSRKWPLRMVLGCSSSFILTAVTMSGDTSSLSLHMACLMLLCLGVWICNSLSPDWWDVLLPSAWRSSQRIVSCDLVSSFLSVPCWGARWGSILGGPHIVTEQGISNIPCQFLLAPLSGSFPTCALALIPEGATESVYEG